MKIYIAGSIAGDKRYKAKFQEAAQKLTAAGHIALNPATQPAGLSRADYMRVCFAMMEAADVALFLPGYRDKYIAALAHSVMAGALPITAIEAMDYNEAKNVLKSVQGIGEKVANCVLLYGMGHLEAFPVDTWIRRVLDREFSDGFPMERYAGFAGLIQQLIFYYERRK